MCHYTGKNKIMSIRFRKVMAIREAVALADTLIENDSPTLLYRNQNGLYLQNDFAGGSVTIAIGEGGNNFYTTVSRSNLRADRASMGVEEHFEFEAPIYATARRPMSINYDKVVLRPFDPTNFRSLLFFGIDNIHLSKQTLTYHAVLSRPDMEAVTAPIFKARAGEVIKPILTREFVFALLKMATGKMHCGFFDNHLIVRCGNIEIVSDGRVHYRKTFIPPIGIHRSFSANAVLKAAKKLWLTDERRQRGTAKLVFNPDHLTISNENGHSESIAAFHETYAPLTCTVAADTLISACRGFIGYIHCAGGASVHFHSLTDYGLEYLQTQESLT